MQALEYAGLFALSDKSAKVVPLGVQQLITVKVALKVEYVFFQKCFRKLGLISRADYQNKLVANQQ